MTSSATAENANITVAAAAVSALERRLADLQASMAARAEQLEPLTRELTHQRRLSRRWLWWNRYLRLAALIRQPGRRHEYLPLGLVIVGAITGAALFVVLPLDVDSPILHMLVAAILGGVMGSGALATLLYYPRADQLGVASEEAKRALQQHHARGTELEAQIANAQPNSDQQQELARLTAELQEAQAQLAAAQQATADTATKFLRCNWQAMRGVEFEDFLASVLRALGGKVKTTKTGSDERVDLMVSFGQRKVAIKIQATVRTISNVAVQEVERGREYYDCDGCAVITNSRFSPSARQLADKIGCVLVDEKTLPDLAAGRLKL